MCRARRTTLATAATAAFLSSESGLYSSALTSRPCSTLGRNLNAIGTDGSLHSGDRRQSLLLQSPKRPRPTSPAVSESPSRSMKESLRCRVHDITEHAAGPEAATRSPATLSQANCSGAWETYVGSFKVRPKTDSESFIEAKAECILVFGSQELEDSRGQAPEDKSTTECSSGRTLHNSVLVVEERSGNRCVGFCGALQSQSSAGMDSNSAAFDAYVCVVSGREIPQEVAPLLVQALHGWVRGPEAAASAAQRARAAARPQGATGVSDAEAEEEMVDWVDTRGRVICAVPRPVVHANNILHRGAGVMIRNYEGEVYCHRRTSTKRVFPSMYDMFIGGVSATMEPALTTALRELGEELGLGPLGERSGVEKEESLPMPVHRGDCLIETDHNRCLVSVFDYLASPAEIIRWQPEEVAWGSYVPWQEVEAKVSSATWEFVPDGLQVWRKYLGWGERQRV